MHEHIILLNGERRRGGRRRKREGKLGLTERGDWKLSVREKQRGEGNAKYLECQDSKKNFIMQRRKRKLTGFSCLDRQMLKNTMQGSSS